MAYTDKVAAFARQGPFRKGWPGGSVGQLPPRCDCCGTNRVEHMTPLVNPHGKVFWVGRNCSGTLAAGGHVRQDGYVAVGV